MQKPVLILLHGALGSKKQMQPLADMLSPHFEVHARNLPGHGGRELPAQYTCELFAEDVMDYINKLPAERLPVNIFGYSMGGYVGAYLALHHPVTINKVFGIAVKYGWDAASTEAETRLLNVEKMKEKIPAFCEALEKDHAPQSWEELVNKTREMMTAFSKNPPLKETDFSLIQKEVMIALGDRDKTADVKNSVEVYAKLPKGKMLVLPNTGHPMDKIDLALLTPFILSFFK